MASHSQCWWTVTFKHRPATETGISTKFYNLTCNWKWGRRGLAVGNKILFSSAEDIRVVMETLQKPFRAQRNVCVKAKRCEPLKGILKEWRVERCRWNTDMQGGSGVGDMHDGKSVVSGLVGFECQSDHLRFPWKGRRMCNAVPWKVGVWRQFLTVNAGCHRKEDTRVA